MTTYTGAIATIAAGETTTVSVDLATYRDALKALSDPWTSYTPTLNGWTIGNGTVTGAYSQLGKLVHFRGVFTVGSSTSPSGGPSFDLPAAATAVGRDPIGWATLFDTSGTAWRHWPLVLFSGTACMAINPDGTALSPTAPWTWATGDRIQFSGVYEAA